MLAVLALLVQAYYSAQSSTVGRYVKANGELMMHKNLTRQRPYFVPTKVECDQAILKVGCLNSVVWALTDDRSLIVRTGVKRGCEEGDAWHYLGR